jgi:hypothetical protein
MARRVVKLARWFPYRDGLIGVSQGHPNVVDGHRAFTSPIVGREGEYVVTQSGTRYELTDGDAQAFLSELTEIEQEGVNPTMTK